MSSSGSRDRAGDRLSPLESVVTDPAHEDSRNASAHSIVCLGNPPPGPIELESPDESTEGTSNSTAPAGFVVNDTHYSERRLWEAEIIRERQRLSDVDTRRERYEQFRLIQENKVKLEEQRKVLSRLKAWHDWDENRHKSLRNYILSKVGYPRRPSLPGRNELSPRALFYFPPRMKLKVILCDYGHDRFDRFEVELGRVESGMFLISA